jgi:hypothetical protein
MAKPILEEIGTKSALTSTPLSTIQAKLVSRYGNAIKGIALIVASYNRVNRENISRSGMSTTLDRFGSRRANDLKK